MHKPAVGLKQQLVASITNRETLAKWLHFVMPQFPQVEKTGIRVLIPHGCYEN